MGRDKLFHSCCTVTDSCALQTGIYRVPGENRVMQLMQAKLNGKLGS